VRRLIEYALYRLLAFLTPLLPRRVAVWLGRRLGGLYFFLSARARRVGLENLARVLPERNDHRAILLEAAREHGVALIDVLWSARLDTETIARYFEAPENHLKLLRDCLARGRGVVMATAHFGSWEMLNLAGGMLNLPRATFIARPVRNARIDRHMRKMRERTGNRLVYRDAALPACVGALRRNEIVCSVIDMAITPAEGGLFVDFCGTPALTSGALPLLAVRRRAPLLFAVCRPLDGEGEEIEIRDTEEDRVAEVRRVTREMNRALERMVRKHPECWIWDYKRWKARPSELPGDYPSYALWVHPHW